MLVDADVRLLLSEMFGAWHSDEYFRHSSFLRFTWTISFASSAGHRWACRTVSHAAVHRINILVIVQHRVRWSFQGSSQSIECLKKVFVPLIQRLPRLFVLIVPFTEFREILRAVEIESIAWKNERVHRTRKKQSKTTRRKKESAKIPFS